MTCDLYLLVGIQTPNLQNMPVARLMAAPMRKMVMSTGVATVEGKGGSCDFFQGIYQDPKVKHEPIITPTITSEHWFFVKDLILFHDSTPYMLFSAWGYGTVAKGCPETAPYQS